MLVCEKCYSKMKQVYPELTWIWCFECTKCSHFRYEVKNPDEGLDW